VPRFDSLSRGSLESFFYFLFVKEGGSLELCRLGLCTGVAVSAQREEEAG
jgi:hypothetical protein